MHEIINNGIFLIISFLASLIGAICGVGGGIIIKPVLDTFNIMSVSTISFLSSCTVLAMSLVSVYKNIRSNTKIDINLRISTFLGIGAAIGGVLGNNIFRRLKLLFENENIIGAIQAFLLIIITILTLIYIKNKEKIKTINVSSPYSCALIGLLLGVISSFLGIGGGPINLVVLSYFFSMKTKSAAANSIYIIMFSQITNFLSVLISKSIPDFNVDILIVMILGGIVGGLLGSKVNINISTMKVDKLFKYLILLIITINVYNFFKFAL